jgi:hypothetical protein
MTSEALRELEQVLARCEKGDPAWRNAAKLVRAELTARPCACLSPFGIHPFDRRDIGETSRGAELSIDTCRVWIHYFFEDHIHEYSGRWFRGIVDPNRAAALDADEAVALLNAMPWKLYNGSYYNLRGGATAGTLPNA